MLAVLELWWDFGCLSSFPSLPSSINFVSQLCKMVLETNSRWAADLSFEACYSLREYALKYSILKERLSRIYCCILPQLGDISKKWWMAVWRRDWSWVYFKLLEVLLFKDSPNSRMVQPNKQEIKKRYQESWKDGQVAPDKPKHKKGSVQETEEGSDIQGGI